MKKPQKPLRIRAFAQALVSALLLASFGAGAATRTYFGLNNGLWNVAGNWNPGAVPVAGDDVFLGSHAPAGGGADLNVSFNGLIAAGAELGSLNLNSSAVNGTMILIQTASGSVMRAKVENWASSSVPAAATSSS